MKKIKTTNTCIFSNGIKKPTMVSDLQPKVPRSDQMNEVLKVQIKTRELEARRNGPLEYKQ